jgi:hypothetical protein
MRLQPGEPLARDDKQQFNAIVIPSKARNLLSLAPAKLLNPVLAKI